MSEESFADFIDDYYAESEEHLTSARAALLELEASVDQPANQHRLVHDLFRFFHSLKGISAMVELRPAERLSHELESYLRAVRSGELAVTPDGITLLLEATQAIEQIISAHRSKQPGPAIDAILGRIARAIPAAAPSPPVMSTGSQGSPGESKQAARWKCTFAPTRELFDRGISVDIIRRRLAEVGMVVEASPLVMPDASIAFNFTVEAAGDADLRTVLQNDPLAVERLEKQPKAAEAVASIAPAELDSETGGTTSLAPSQVVRVDLTRLDELMRNVGDLVISRARLTKRWHASNATCRRSSGARCTTMPSRSIGKCGRCAKGSCGSASSRSARSSGACRSWSATSPGKRQENHARAQGQSTEIDKYLIERMMDPVLHLVRNAVGHGIGSRMSASPRQTAGGHHHAQRLDRWRNGHDRSRRRGRGIDAQPSRPGPRGLPVPAGTRMPRRAHAALRARVFDQRRRRSRQRARVGMAVVKQTIEQLSGTISSKRNRDRDPFHHRTPADTRHRRRAHRPGWDGSFAIPQSAVREVIEVAARMSAHRSNEIVPYRDGGAADRPASGCSASRRAAGAVSRLRGRHGRGCRRPGRGSHVGQREIVVRAIADPLVRVDGIAGATDLGDGRVVLILDPLS